MTTDSPNGQNPGERMTSPSKLDTCVIAPTASLTDDQLRERWRFMHPLSTMQLLYFIAILCAIASFMFDGLITPPYHVATLIGAVALWIIQCAYLRFASKRLDRTQLMDGIRCMGEALADDMP